MSSVSAASGAAMPAAAGQIDPRLQAVIGQLPADQQAAATAKLQSMSPADQQALIAKVEQAAAQQAPAAGASAPAAPAVDQAAVGAAAAAPPSRMATILKKVAIFGGIGAALGFGASFLTLPVIGQVAAPIAAAVGGGIGALVGLFMGMKQSSADQATYDQAQAAAAQAAPAPGAPGAMPGAAPGIEPAGTNAPPMLPGGIPGPGSVGASASRRTPYTVVRGDNLSTIAARFDLTWQELYRANRAAVGSDPDMIHPGLRLRIPTA